MTAGPQTILSTILDRKWLTNDVFELVCDRPAGYGFSPGQYAVVYQQQHCREYTIISAADDPVVRFLVRHIPSGLISSFLATAPVGTPLGLGRAKGYLTFKASSRPAVFVATGVGVAPFVAMAHSGIRNFTLIHGIRLHADRYYQDLFARTASRYVACISREQLGSQPETEHCFSGRVTTYLETVLTPRICDFYLCGSADMIRDVLLILDQKFRGSNVYYESFT